MNTEPADLEVSVAAVLQNYSPELAGKTVLLALSGGADSVSLLYSSASLQSRFGFSLRCIHVNHRLRPAEETDLDARVIKEHCKKLKVPLTIVKIRPGAIEAYANKHKLGIEAAARAFRHRAFKRQMYRWSASWLFIGHTRDDVLELALMRFLRGSGPSGLARLPERRGPILRPLVYSSRKDVEVYLEKQHILFTNDSTNKDSRYLRNRIRNVLIPLLDREFSFWRAGVLEAAHTQSQAASCISDITKHGIPWQKHAHRTLWAYQTDLSTFFNQPLIIREEALFQAIDHLRRDKGGASVAFLNPDGDMPPKITTVRRSSVRKFASGMVKALDLSDCRLLCDGPYVQVQKKQRYLGDSGFSQVFTTAGNYPVEGLVLSIQPVMPGLLQSDGRIITVPCIFRLPEPGDRLLYHRRMRTLAEVRNLSQSGPWSKQYVIEDLLGIAVYMLIDIHSNICIYWRESLPETVERKASFMIEIQSRGNHARRSKR